MSLKMKRQKKRKVNAMAAKSLGWDKFEDANKNPQIYWKLAKPSQIDYNLSDLNKLPAPSQSKSPDALYDRISVDFFKKEIKNLKQKIEEIEKMVGQLAEKMENIENDYIEIRDIPFDQAKAEIAKYFLEHDGENIDPADIEENLGIEFDMAFEICEELEAEGKIKGV